MNACCVAHFIPMFHFRFSDVYRGQRYGKLACNKFILIWHALRNLAPLVQFKKREKHPWRVLLLIKLQANTLPWVFFTFFKLYKCYQIAQPLHIFKVYNKVKRSRLYSQYLLKNNKNAIFKQGSFWCLYY